MHTSIGRPEGAVDPAGNVEFFGQMVEGGDRPGADRGQNPDAGLAVLPEALDDALIATAVGLIGLERCH